MGLSLRPLAKRVGWQKQRELLAVDLNEAITPSVPGVECLGLGFVLTVLAAGECEAARQVGPGAMSVEHRLRLIRVHVPFKRQAVVDPDPGLSVGVMSRQEDIGG